MTPEQFSAIFKQFKFKLKHASYLLPDDSADAVNRWTNGLELIPIRVADRLRYLHIAYEELKVQAIEEAQTAGQTVYWPMYVDASDFKDIDPQRYESFLGCEWVYTAALIHAELTFASWRRKGIDIKGDITRRCLTKKAFFSWLQHHGLTNTEANRRRLTAELHERYRPQTDAEFTAQMHRLLASTTASDKEHQFASGMLILQRAAEGRGKAYRRQRNGLEPVPPSPTQVVDNFFATRASV